MRSAVLLTFGVALGACTPPPEDPTETPVSAYDPLVWVDPMIGTGGTGAQVTGVTPAASAPLGMVFVGPDTRSTVTGDIGPYHFGGYHFDDDEIEGFTHTHAYAMGINEYGAVHVMPRAAWSDGWLNDRTRAAPFSHDQEWATPGRYAVDLLDDGTHVEIAATPRGALHTYTFAPGSAPVVVFDLAHTEGNVVIDYADWSVDLATAEVRGFQRLSGGYSGRHGGVGTYFAAVLDPAPTGSGTWNDGAIAPTTTSVSGADCGAWLSFPEGTTEVRMRLAISYVDADGAWANLQAELPDFDGDAALGRTESAWREALSRVRVRGGTDAERRIFHTALYHSLLMPSRFADVDGRYRGVDQAVHTANFDYLTDLSLWDTFRTLHPLWTLAWPERQRDVLKSLLAMGEDGGSLARWPLGDGYTGGMVGTPADQLFAGSYLKGLDGWDADAAFDLAYAASTAPQDHAGRGGLDGYLTRGFVAIEDSGQSASKTLEYAWSDHAMAGWATALGRPTEASQLTELSQAWRNVWSPEYGFFLAHHTDGTVGWERDRQFVWTDDFTEGDAWHYLWYVPYDVPGMIDVQHGGDRSAFLDKTYTYWDNVAAEDDDALPDDYYWHGNEPVLHYAFLGSLAGEPWLTGEASRWVMTHRYSDGPLGLDGNDDSGTLSAWYAFAAMGIYPVAGTETYALGAPIFERVEIDREDGGAWVIRAPGAGDDAPYLQSARLTSSEGDDTALNDGVVTHSAWRNGGDLVLEMGPRRRRLGQ